jgi:hypothetical protein
VWYGSDGWHLQQINNANGRGASVSGEYIASPAATAPVEVGIPFVSVFNDQQHYTYLDSNGNIQDVWYGPDGWHLQQINNANNKGASVPGEYIASSAATAPAGHPYGLFVSVFNNQQHFAYLDPNGNIQDVWYDGGENSSITVTPTSIVVTYNVDLEGLAGGSITGPISVTITSNGSYNFTGQITNGADAPYTYSVIVVLKSKSGTAFVFAKSSSIGGDLPFTNNNFTWNDNGTNGTIQGVWGDLQAETTYHYKSSSDLDISAIWNDVKNAIGDYKDVVTVVGSL